MKQTRWLPDRLASSTCRVPIFSIVPIDSSRRDASGHTGRSPGLAAASVRALRCRTTVAYKLGTKTYGPANRPSFKVALSVSEVNCYARGRFLDTSREIALRLPRAYCEFCTTRTPHVHERLAINGVQVTRSVCFICKRERPKGQPHEPRS